MSDVAEVLRHPAGPDDARRDERINVGEAERWISGLTGAGLIVAGLSQRSTAGFALAVLGGALAWRGASGNCALYSSLGWTTATHRPKHAERGADRWASRPMVPFGEAGSRLGQTRDARLEEDLEQSFPASDAPTHMSGAARAGAAPDRR